MVLNVFSVLPELDEQRAYAVIWNVPTDFDDSIIDVSVFSGLLYTELVTAADAQNRCFITVWRDDQSYTLNKVRFTSVAGLTKIPVQIQGEHGGVKKAKKAAWQSLSGAQLWAALATVAFPH